MKTRRPEIRTATQTASRRLLQRKCACGQHTSGGAQCEECKKKNLALQRHSDGATGATTAPTIVHDVLRSPGQPLDAGARAFFEPRFEHDFSNVRVHTDETAAASARAVNASAYTVGRDLVFAAGRYSPATSEGRKLVAHELTHVVQQSAPSGVSSSPALAEAEAEHNAAAVVQAQSPALQTGAGAGSLQRKESEQGGEPEEAGIATALEGSWHEYYDLALQGTAGISDLSAAQKAELTAKIADEVVLLMSARAPVERAKGEDFPERDWKEHFKSALQTTSGATYQKKRPLALAAKKAVASAAEIADAAVQVSREGRNRLKKLFKPHPASPEKSKKSEAPVKSETAKKVEAPKKSEAAKKKEEQ